VIAQRVSDPVVSFSTRLFLLALQDQKVVKTNHRGPCGAPSYFREV
jgi:hypothetical protein